MKLGITGLAGSGKTTIFEALTRNLSETGNKSENRIGTISVPDERMDLLERIYQPKKNVYVQVEYFLPGYSSDTDKKKDETALAPLRECDALIHVVRNFNVFGLEKPEPVKDFMTLEQERILADLVAIDKRIERLELEKKRGKKINPEEMSLLNDCKKQS